MAWQTLQYLAAPVAYLTRAHQRYGDVFTARLLGQNWVVLANPDAIREVFGAAQDQLLAGEASRVLEPLIGTHNTLMLDGQDYLHRRRLLLPAFHGSTLKRHERMIRELTQRELATWPTDVPFAALPHLQKLAAKIAQQCVLGESGNELAAAVLNLLTWLTSTGHLAYYFAFGAQQLMRLPGYRTRQQRVDEHMRNEIQTRRQAHKPEQTDILTLLINSRDQHGQPLSDNDLHDETITLLVAGHENTAAMLSWAIHELARNPSIQNQLATNQADWSELVIAETLRLRPPVPIVPRRLATPLTLAGHKLQAGTNIAPCVLLAHRDPTLYPDPITFNPTRFLRQRPSAWFPFGGGTRRCIGEAFAQTEMRLILQELTSMYHIQATGPPERTRPRALVLVPAKGARITLRRRSPESTQGCARRTA
jgi:cytochrome P450